MSVSFIRSPIFTRHFTPEEYGNYTLVFITFSYLSILLLTWISSCFWRFYPKYNYTDKKRDLYSSIFYLILASLFIIFIVTVILYYKNTNIHIKRLVIFAFLHIISAESLNIINIPIRYEGKARLYNIINIIRAIAGFSILLILTFGLKQGIESFLASTSTINFILIISILLFYNAKDWIKPLKPNFKIIKEVFNYGKSGLLANVGLLLLINSDRYLIGIFSGKDKVGIYNQLYNIAQLSIAAIVNIFFAVINPIFLNVLENNKKEQDNYTTKYYILLSLIIIPLTVYFSLFTHEICHIMLGERFRIGQNFLPAIMFSSLLYGYTLFHEVRLKFSDKINKVVQGTLLASLINLVLNLIIIPKFGYLYATLTTLISYLFLFIYLFQHDNFKSKYLLAYMGLFIRIFLIIAIEAGLFYLIKWQMGWDEVNLGFAILEGLVFLLLYFVIIYFSKSFKSLIGNLN